MYNMCSLGRSPPYINQNPFCLCTLSDLQPLYHSLSVILYITHKALVVHREAEALLPADHTVHHGRSRIHPLERCRFREVGNHPSQLQQCGLPAQRGHCCVQASCHAILPAVGEPVLRRPRHFLQQQQQQQPGREETGRVDQMLRHSEEFGGGRRHHRQSEAGPQGAGGGVLQLQEVPQAGQRGRGRIMVQPVRVGDLSPCRHRGAGVVPVDRVAGRQGPEAGGPVARRAPEDEGHAGGDPGHRGRRPV
uniref:Uncharacterized protein n=2 Tax=Physcomitrium patens TaxID=3218 RepID=A0A7I4C690_PHYPA